MRVRSLVVSVVRCVVGTALVLTCVAAQAAGPRWVSGPPFFSAQGVAIAWYTNHPTYFTDPGDLSASVNHAAADALVARAAAVWNVPTASLVLAQGGSLDEHVTGASITVAGSATASLPADAQATNWQAKPIAVIYDTDGSVIDALLGAGGSDPSGCLQNGVVESVDSFGVNATIQHAVLVLNGRCTGPEPEKQLQLQYQLERAFGRVLGLGWSQTNDNVFTSVPVPTKNDAANWPIMHPIDVICGPYTYQCLPQPFTLRADDVAAVSAAVLYLAGPGRGDGRKAGHASECVDAGRVHHVSERAGHGGCERDGAAAAVLWVGAGVADGVGGERGELSPADGNAGHGAGCNGAREHWDV